MVALRPWVGLIIAGLGFGCGYQLAGRASGGPHQALWIAPVDDEGDEPLFGAKLARELARETVDRGDLALTDSARADASLSVRVDSVSEKAVAFVAGDIIKEYVVRAETTATVRRNGDEVIWRGKGIWADREYPAGTTVNETENNKDVALNLLASDLAREILQRTSLVLAGVAP